MAPIGRKNTIRISPQMVHKVVERFKGRSPRTDEQISDSEIVRMADSASLIPVAKSPTACIVDVGGTVFWLPIYGEILGYREIVILSRPGGTFLEYFDKGETDGRFDFQIHDCDVELSTYPIDDEKASCVVCFEVLEHLAGDPMSMVAECNRILEKDGAFCLKTPNVLYWKNLLRFAFGEHPFGWSVFTDSYADRHNREYTPYEVKRMLEAGGFNASSIGTSTPGDERSIEFRKLFGYLLCLPAFVAKRVSFQMRGKSIGVQAIKNSPVVDRYPEFLYEMFGQKEVEFKCRRF